MKTKKAIFLDFGDTLASTEPPYIYRIAMALREAGLDISDNEFELEYLKADYALYLKHKSRGGISPEEHREWFFPLIYEALSPIEDIEKFRAKVRSSMAEIDFTRAALPGVTELLDYLKGKGYRLGVISNNDGRTEEKCEEVGIRDYFDFIFDSTNLGMVKPDSGIFLHALGNFGVAPAEALYIGDLYGSDVLGGTDAGLEVIWLNRRRFDKLDGSDVAEVTEMLEVKRLLEGSQL